MLYLPGIMVVTCKGRGLLATFGHVVTILALQGLLGLPFLREYPREYLAGAFDFSRVFLYKWTANWRFIPEDTFLSKLFAKELLAAHLVILVVFLLTRWFVGLRGPLATIARATRYPTRPPFALPATSECESSPRIHPCCLTLRCSHSCHFVHVQPHRNNLCTLSALPVLLVVRPTTTSACVEDVAGAEGGH